MSRREAAAPGEGGGEKRNSWRAEAAPNRTVPAPAEIRALRIGPVAELAAVEAVRCRILERLEQPALDAWDTRRLADEVACWAHEMRRHAEAAVRADLADGRHRLAAVRDSRRAS